MRILAVIGIIGVVIVVAAGAFFFAGFYNVAASAGDVGIVNWAMAYIREASIKRQANETPPIKLDDPATVREGARAFAEQGCANCHGAPGVKSAKFSEGLDPGPPDLKDVGKEDDPAHIFWAVKNGIRMTGMPSFGKAGVPDKEIWQIVALIKKLPTTSEADFKAWTAPQTPPAAAPSVAPPKKSQQ